MPSICEARGGGRIRRAYAHPTGRAAELPQRNKAARARCRLDRPQGTRQVCSNGARRGGAGATEIYGMSALRVGFIGLGNVGGQLAGNLLHHGIDLTVRDLDAQRVAAFTAQGARSAATPRALAEGVDLVITCLPSPAISAEVMEAPDGVIAGLTPGKIWLEMSTTDQAEARRLAARVEQQGAAAMDCPVSGGCHRAATGNISIFAGGPRATFERVLPVLAILGQRILHTGPVGSASALKVLTNYLCTVHLVALCEALTVAKVAGMDLNTAYEAIRISSGNSFVHETESQVILNGSRDINFTMDLVIKDVGTLRYPGA